MPNNEIEKRKEYQKEYQKTYRENNIEKRKEYKKKWREDNKEKEREYQKKWRTDNKDKQKNYNKIYYIKNTEKEIKRVWKNRGLIDDYEMVYERYSMAIFCDICECVLDQCTKSVKCMDHCHKTGLFRNIVCRNCNFKIG